MTCYNCGRPVSRKGKVEESDDVGVVLKMHREHVPAICFFNDGIQETKNRITVPACKKCNHKYSEIDNELRDALGVGNQSLAEGLETTDKSVRSIMNQKNWHNRIVAVQGMVRAVSFDWSKVQDIFLKNFKALFYQEYKMSLNEDWGVAVWYDGYNYRKGNSAQEIQQHEKAANMIADFVLHNNDWKVSGSEEIFSYMIKPIVGKQEANGIGFELADSLENAGFVGMIQVYHLKLEALVVGVNLKNIKPNES